MDTKIPKKSIERLSLYRRLLMSEFIKKRENIYSHELAQIAGESSAQVRRDLMVLEHLGSPRKGYRVEAVIDEISALLGKSRVTKQAIFGIGNLGRAILAYFANGMQDMPIIAAFDINPDMINRVISGCHAYDIKELEVIHQKDPFEIAILALPHDVVQDVVDRLIILGVRSFVSFAHIPLQVPEGVFVENVDIIQAIEKAIYFSPQR